MSSFATLPADTPPGPPLLHVVDGCGTVTLRRPAHMNRLHGEDLHVLQAHAASLAADTTVRAVVLTGIGPVFCGGYHLGELAAGDPDDPTGTRLFARTVDAWAQLAVPTVCRLNGSVYGGAADLALACDFRIGVDAMHLRVPPARLGLHYYPSGLARYVGRLGLGAAKRILLTAQTLDAATLLRLGYLDEAVPAERLDAEVAHWVQALAANGPLAVQGMKQSLDELADGRADAAAIEARELRCARSADLQEGLRALAEKRTPRFEGR